MFSTNIYGFKNTVFDGLQKLIGKGADIGRIKVIFQKESGNYEKTFGAKDIAQIKEAISTIYLSHEDAHSVICEVYNHNKHLVKDWERSLAIHNSAKNNTPPTKFTPATHLNGFGGLNGAAELLGLKMENISLNMSNAHQIEMFNLKQDFAEKIRDLKQTVRDKDIEIKELKKEFEQAKRLGRKYKEQNKQKDTEIDTLKSTETYTKYGGALFGAFGPKLGLISEQAGSSMLGSIFASPQLPQQPNKKELSLEGEAARAWLETATESEQEMLYRMLYPAITSEEQGYIKRLYDFITDYNEKRNGQAEQQPDAQSNDVDTEIVEIET